MRTGIRILLSTAAAAALTLAGSAAASAESASTVWKWGSIHSSDHGARANGKVVAAQSGLEVRGTLYDNARSGCGWVLLHYQSSTNGKWRAANYWNCANGPGTFREKVGGVLQIKAKVCRGTSKRPTGRCSGWRTIYTQGG
ncbi:hypothetical protein FHS43_002134 [Streptosporangium becharense]|uniref:Secreted protein n=1 Tax=Streptosporangium becharense TaxID=1816182 RepID=A0A7W9IC72_9ACTN|nr:hypothetical protein [Streptosporangium becharense]MBB2910871.1 hypothetical protein [Streptosporangium becharense]MBB5817566.1 hypothetical protein [Streptosporangium becharense]